MRSPVIEDWLERQKVKHAYWEVVPLARIDADRSLRNQARMDRALDQKTVESYAQAMRDGASFPALIAYKVDPDREKLATPGADLVLITGNHRMAAAIEANRADFDVYVVEDASPLVRERLTRTANFLEGRRPPPEEALQHAMWLVSHDGYTAGAAAKMTNLRRSGVETALRAERTRSRLLSMGIDATGGHFAQAVLDRLGALRGDPVLEAAARAVIDYHLSTELAAEMLRRVHAGRSEAEQLRLIEDFCAQDYVRQRPQSLVDARQGSYKIKPGHRILGNLTTARNYIERYPDPTSAGLIEPADFQRVLDVWADLQTGFAQWANKGRRRYGLGTLTNKEADHGGDPVVGVRSA